MRIVKGLLPVVWAFLAFIALMYASMLAQQSAALYGVDSSGVNRRVRCTAVSGSTTDCTLNLTSSGSQFQASDGTFAAPSYSFLSNTGTGWLFNAAGQVGLGLGGGTTPMILFGGNTASFPALKRSGTVLQARLADDSGGTAISASTFQPSQTGVNLINGTAPTITSPGGAGGWGSGGAITNNNGAAAFTITVGTGGTATTGQIGMPTAGGGWNCWVNDLTAAAARVGSNTRQISSTTTLVNVENQTTSTGAAIAWAANDILRVSCFSW